MHKDKIFSLCTLVHQSPQPGLELSQRFFLWNLLCVHRGYDDFRMIGKTLRVSQCGEPEQPQSSPPEQNEDQK